MLYITWTNFSPSVLSSSMSAQDVHVLRLYNNEVTESRSSMLRGAEEACWAHNPKVLGSKPSGARCVHSTQWGRWVLPTQRHNGYFYPHWLNVLPIPSLTHPECKQSFYSQGRPTWALRWSVFLLSMNQRCWDQHLIEQDVELMFTMQVFLSQWLTSMACCLCVMIYHA